jgi:HEAT repeat protein
VSLDILRKKTQMTDEVTYLKARNLLPFFYKRLADRHKGVRESALLCIQNFGPQGELMFIEGATKDRSPIIRAECVSGLGQIGPATFRTLLLVLHDGDHTVREAASNAIVKNMTP